MRRITLIALLLLLAAVASPAPPGLAQSSQPAAVQQAVGGRADFNQDGFADLAVGAPDEDIGSISDAGAVTVLYGTASGLSGNGSQLFTQVGGAIETQDFFGSALAAGDFNHDGFADLAASAPFETVGNLPGAGAVSVLYGSAGGLAASGGRLFTLIGSIIERGQNFAYSLATGDFDHDGFAELAAGAPGHNEFAGAVSVLQGSAGGLTDNDWQLFTQDSSGIPGAGEAGDSFGYALTAGSLGPAPATASTPGSASTQRPTTPNR